MEVPSNPFSAKRVRLIWISCSLRSLPVIRLRDLGSVTVSIMAVLEEEPVINGPVINEPESDNALRREALGGARAQGGAPPEPLEDPEDAGAEVDLTLQRAVPGAGGVGVVQ